jgi:hypothetical protein
VAAVVVLWASIALGMARTGLGFFEDRPLSYLGTDAKTSLLFTAAMVVSAFLFAGFYLFVYDRYAASRSFLVVGFAGLLGQVVAGLVPLSGPGASHAVHVTGGIVVGLSLPLLMWRFAASQPRSSWRRKNYAFVWFEVAACIIGVLLSRSMRAAIAEIIPGAGYHLWILVVTIRSPTTTTPPPSPRETVTGRAACT